MNPAELSRELAEGKLRPVYLLTGEERFLLDRAVRSVRALALTGAVPDFNEDVLTAGEAHIDKVMSAARTVPMMAKRRFVLVRAIERWDAKDEGGDARSLPPLDRLAEYADRPVDTTCLVLTAGKLDGRRKLVTLAKKQGFLVSCEPLDDAALARWIEGAAAERGASIAPGTARFLAQVAGPDLSNVADAVERLSLYVGKGAPITEDAVADIVVRVRETSVFALVDAVGRRDRGKALAALAEVYDPRDRGLPLLGLLAWSVRQLVRFDAATRAGARPDDAAKAAGAPPFKARDLAAQMRTLSPEVLERWLLLLAQADLALKGDKRPPQAVLETLVLSMAAS